jgi:hypothetical protein
MRVSDYGTFVGMGIPSFVKMNMRVRYIAVCVGVDMDVTTSNNRPEERVEA